MVYRKRGAVYDREWIKELWAAGFSAAFIAREVGCSKKLVWYVTNSIRTATDHSGSNQARNKKRRWESLRGQAIQSKSPPQSF